MAVPRLEVTSSETLELERVFARFVRTVRGQFREIAGSVGLTPAELVLLGRVQEAADATPGEIAREIGVTPAAVTFLVRDLIESGCLRRSRSPRDARRVVLSVTADGRRRLASVRRSAVRTHRRVRGALSKAEMASLAVSLDRLTTVLTEPPKASASRFPRRGRRSTQVRDRLGRRYPP
ncbi:MAG TPA: MarR family transcriptional regulator [Thermoplasmata archaeon]|nr:MarR family transcriptional regulator [Thermoplasmata archaeon]